MKIKEINGKYFGVGFYKLNKYEKDKLLNWIKNKMFVQVVRGDIFVSYFHAFHSLYQTWLAFERKINISKNFQLEILLRSIGTRQIDDALDYAGIKEDSNFVCLMIIRDKKEEIEKIEKDFIETFEAKETTPSPNIELIRQIFGTDFEPAIISRISLLNLESHARRTEY